MSAPKDYYAVLEIPRTESLDGIHKAFRRLAKQCHPDHAGAQAAGRFRGILEAYEVLADPQQKQLYDEALNKPYLSSTGTSMGGPVRRIRPEPLAMNTSMAFVGQNRPVHELFRQEVREFARSAEVLLSPVLFSAKLTTDEVDFIRLYLSQLIDRYGPG